MHVCLLQRLRYLSYLHFSPFCGSGTVKCGFGNITLHKAYCVVLTAAATQAAAQAQAAAAGGHSVYMGGIVHM